MQLYPALSQSTDLHRDSVEPRDVAKKVMLFLALGNDPISQYYSSHPDDYFADQEQAYTDPSNPFVQEYQILAMTCDKPISKSELYTNNYNNSNSGMNNRISRIEICDAI
jgi:ATP-dependent helicase YprA (DUF1998 family)